MGFPCRILGGDTWRTWHGILPETSASTEIDPIQKHCNFVNPTLTLFLSSSLVSKRTMRRQELQRFLMSRVWQWRATMTFVPERQSILYCRRLRTYRSSQYQPGLKERRVEEEEPWHYNAATSTSHSKTVNAIETLDEVFAKTTLENNQFSPCVHRSLITDCTPALTATESNAPNRKRRSHIGKCGK